MDRQLSDNKTRKISPWCGCAGFLGFLGFLGFWTYPSTKDTFPFVFFMFFGFFGFFFEGKMSHTLKDERYLENRSRAQLSAFRTGFRLVSITLFISTQEQFFHSADGRLLFVTISLSLTFGFVAFLLEYLLYRYDRSDDSEE